ncbi:ATP-dependent helicase, partial [Candidatus Peregrinibacteria bacterium]|nr:ATP-dependent helicase [Candidatus Peregrinibacteria bacterium]
NRTLLETMERVFTDCKVLRSLSSLDPIDFAALQAFFEFVKYRFYEQKQRSFSFEALMHDLALYSDGEYGLRLTYTMPHLTREGVQLLTAHQSKGMEFDVVILPNFRDGHWDGRRNPPSVSIPEDLLFGWDGDQRAFEKRQDERRVAYVAMTRARHTLILSCPAELSSGGAKPKSVSPSGFAVEAGIVREEKGALKNPDKCLTLLFQKPKATDEGWRTYLLERVSDFKLSATALNHFLEDPQLFLEQDLLQKPQAIREALVYGNAAHWALKKWGRSVQEGLPLSREQFLHAFEQYLAEREALTDAQRSNLTEHGRRMLPRYYDEILAPHIPVIHRVEMPVSAFLGSVPIKGTMDRIDLDHPESRRVTVIDYKTGQPKTEKQIREDGDYFRQLAFYALLMEHGMPTFEPV